MRPSVNRRDADSRQTVPSRLVGEWDAGEWISSLVATSDQWGFIRDEPEQRSARIRAPKAEAVPTTRSTSRMPRSSMAMAPHFARSSSRIRDRASFTFSTTGCRGKDAGCDAGLSGEAEVPDLGEEPGL